MSVETINSYTGIGTLVGFIIIGVMNKLEARKARKLQDKIHVLVNNNMAIQLRVNAYQARRIASMTKSKEDKTAATEAERLLSAHEQQQAKVDASV